ncbi:hypothetical protein OIU76_003339 [Salix suchowensis]|nr:hypothetical protein OIU78_013083 [Salix suchowensis]KAJ6346638.1 hypothetical protein OIU76_003339 [Salix suchowensis]
MTQSLLQHHDLGVDAPCADSSCLPLAPWHEDHHREQQPCPALVPWLGDHHMKQQKPSQAPTHHGQNGIYHQTCNPQLCCIYCTNGTSQMEEKSDLEKKGVGPLDF